jgi:peptidoglycan/LPS O-acetylase OafA/YrhL
VEAIEPGRGEVVVSVDMDRPRMLAPPRQPAAPAPATEPAPSRGSSAIPHFPGLEGLRGLAVVAVVAYHARYPWAKGGFLGVSTFFTLSGFLITSLLLNERGATGTIDLRSFWRRRFRRLMPAALAALALVVAFGVTAADAVQRRNLAGDVLASLGYVANWRFLLAQQSYADIFGEASPVAHFWSLAIEEQFYLLLPLVAWFLLIRRGVGRGVFALCLVALTAASLALSLFAGLSYDAAYYHTGTRAAELLIGALLAAAVFDRRVTRPLGRNRAVQSVVATLGLAAFVGCGVLWVITDHSGNDSPWLYHGGFAAYSVLTALVILAAVTPAGPVRWMLAQWPARALGKISYGVYLYHWPIFLWLTVASTKLTEPRLSVVRMVATITLAVVSYNLIEQPIRHAARNPRIHLVRLAIPTVLAIAISVVFVSKTAPKPDVDFESAANALSAIAPDGGPPASKPDVTATEAPFPRISFYGDSTALMSGLGIAKWSQKTKEAKLLSGVARLGCGIGRGGERLDEKHEVQKIPDVCNRWELEFRQSIENEQPTVAVVQIGPWEVAQRRLEGSDKWTGPGDPAYDKYMTDEMLRAVDVLSAQGAVVLWLSAPHIRVEEGSDTMLRGEAADPARMDRLNELIRGLPAQRPGKVDIVDLAGWLDSTHDDKRLRPDGVHFNDDTSPEVADRFLANAILTSYRKMWSQRAATGGTTPSSDVAGKDALGKYLTNKFKVMVVGDKSADVVASGMQVWADKTGGLAITRAIRPDCGLLRTSARGDGTGQVVNTPPDCQSFRQAIIDQAKAEKPDIVVVIPSAWDMRRVRLTTGEPLGSWGSDPAFDKAAQQHYADLVRQLNDVQAVVMWANPPVGALDKGGPGAAAKVLPATDGGAAAKYDEVVKALQAANNKGARRLDMAGWTAKYLPGLKDGTDLSADNKAALGDYLAAQVYLEFDSGAKLKPAR